MSTKKTNKIIKLKDRTAEPNPHYVKIVGSWLTFKGLFLQNKPKGVHFLMIYRCRKQASLAFSFHNVYPNFKIKYLKIPLHFMAATSNILVISCLIKKIISIYTLDIFSLQTPDNRMVQ